MKTRPYEYLLSLGSNVDRRRSTRQALALLTARFRFLSHSPGYDVPAVGGGAGTPRFLNMAVRLRTDLPWRALRLVLRRIEEACGRRRGPDRFAPRTLDLDLVFGGPQVPPGGGLPHPELLSEAYVLCPAAAVWPEALHPEVGRSLAVLAQERFPGWDAAHRAADDAGWWEASDA